MIEQLELQIPAQTMADWQSLVDTMAALIGVPAGLIMRVDDPDIEVFISSHTQGNPYHAGDREHVWDSGLYCETVIKNDDLLIVPNALEDPDWKDNPDVKLDMISYCGLPIKLPDGNPFGTICVLDSKTNAYKQTYISLMQQFRNLIQNQLEQIYMNQALGSENQRLMDYIKEIQILRGLVPICAWCKKVRDGENYWQAVEQYISNHTEAEFTHSICPECMKKVKEIQMP
jgi:GAF domain-containing protein